MFFLPSTRNLEPGTFERLQNMAKNRKLKGLTHCRYFRYNSLALRTRGARIKVFGTDGRRYTI